MNFVLSNGATYIAKKQSGRFTQTTDVKQALVYPNESKALSAIAGLPRAYRNSKYLPKPIEFSRTNESAQELKKSVSSDIPVKNKSVSYSVEDSGWLAELKENLQITAKTIGSLKDTYSRVYQELTNASDEIIDIEHAIEFQKPDAVKKCYLESELKKALRKRRESKDAMALLDLVMKFEQQDWGNGSLRAEINRLEYRSYVPRCRPDLFE